MTYLELIRNADGQLDDGRITIGEYEQMITPLNQEIQPEQWWVPCSERLPEKNCRCLTTNEAWGSFEVDWNAWIDGQWLYPNEKPIAWMPLPEPYRGGDSE